MSWISESEKSWVHRFCNKVLKSGHIPKHVAFIMDGNRRFATKKNIEREQGHILGFDKLAQTLEWCSDLGITEVTVYAFSIENFKRSKEEVDGLMELARQKFQKLIDEREKLDKHGVKIRVLGNLTLLPKDLQASIAEAHSVTKHNSRSILNVCFSYTSRDEICSAMRDISEGVQKGLIEERDITEDLIQSCLYTSQSCPPDMLIRTSGEVRLSDFLLWQTTYSVLAFVKVLWPEYSRWDLYAGMLYYQQHCDAVQKAKHEHDIEKTRQQLEDDIQYITQSEQFNGLNISLQERVQLYSNQRTERIRIFMDYLNLKRQKYLEDICKTM